MRLDFDKPIADNRTDDRRDECRNHSSDQCIVNSLHHIAVREHFLIPLQRKAIKAGKRTTAIKGKYQHI